LKQLSSEQLFEIKQKFLQQIPHPKLIRKQIMVLERDAVNEINAVLPLNSKNDLLVFFEGYMASLLSLKLSISNSKTADILRKDLIELLALQNSLIEKLASYYPTKGVDMAFKVKQSDPFDVYAFKKELEANELTENEIKNYLCQQVKNKENSGISELTKAVIRARTILENE
jgi:hypothetical protein